MAQMVKQLSVPEDVLNMTAKIIRENLEMGKKTGIEYKVLFDW
jgi:hypothetical protein